jgi:pantothenate kinase type III
MRTEAIMKVEITVKVDGRLVKEHVEQVEGTLEQMEERIDSLSRVVASDALQASVDAMPQPRPLFRPTAQHSGTKAISHGRSSD